MLQDSPAIPNKDFLIFKIKNKQHAYRSIQLHFQNGSKPKNKKRRHLKKKASHQKKTPRQSSKKLSQSLRFAALIYEQVQTEERPKTKQSQRYKKNGEKQPKFQIKTKPVSKRKSPINGFIADKKNEKPKSSKLDSFNPYVREQKINQSLRSSPRRMDFRGKTRRDSIELQKKRILGKIINSKPKLDSQYFLKSSANYYLDGKQDKLFERAENHKSFEDYVNFKRQQIFQKLKNVNK